MYGVYQQSLIRDVWCEFDAPVLGSFQGCYLMTILLNAQLLSLMIPEMKALNFPVTASVVTHLLWNPPSSVKLPPRNPRWHPSHRCPLRPSHQCLLRPMCPCQWHPSYRCLWRQSYLCPWHPSCRCLWRTSQLVTPRSLAHSTMTLCVVRTASPMPTGACSKPPSVSEWMN